MALISLAVSILAIFLAIISIVTAFRLNKKSILHSSILHENMAKNHRIENVVNKYMELLYGSKSSDLHGLIEAGIANLSDDEEIKEACRQIANLQAQRDPIQYRKNDIEKIGLLKFFKNITLRQSKSGELDEVINRLLEKY